MPGSTNTPTQDDLRFLQECQDLQALIDYTERLLRRQPNVAKREDAGK